LGESAYDQIEELRRKSMTPITKQKTMEGMAGRVFRLGELVNYQTGAIVSREVISQKTGTVTVFAFDKGQQLSEHTAPFDAMVVGVDGDAEVFIGGEPNRVKSGDTIIMPANVPHALQAVGRFKMLLIMIKK
jgi:quercetin dioxygenase-like cupin family protein